VDLQVDYVVDGLAGVRSGAHPAWRRALTCELSESCVSKGMSRGPVGHGHRDRQSEDCWRTITLDPVVCARGNSMIRRFALKAAKGLGITVPESILLRAGEVKR